MKSNWLHTTALKFTICLGNGHAIAIGAPRLSCILTISGEKSSGIRTVAARKRLPHKRKIRLLAT